MGIVKDFFARKTVGFYISLACAVWSLVCAIVYITGFSPSGVLGSYSSVWVFVCALLAFIGFIAASLFKRTSRLAAPIMAFFIFIALLIFATYGYQYFPEVFYGGFNMAGFMGMNGAFLFCLISFIILLILSNVCVYLKQERSQKADKEEANKEGTMSEVEA